MQSPLKCDNDSCEEFGKEQTEYEVKFENKPYVKLWMSHSKDSKDLAYGEVQTEVGAYCRSCEGTLAETMVTIDLEAQIDWPKAPAAGNDLGGDSAEARAFVASRGAK